MKITALVPIKTNSTRLPNKNFLDFCGRPLYRVILDTLEKIELIEQVIVNTDSEVIAGDCCGRYTKVKIVDRPAFLLGDHITMNKLIAHDLKETSAEHFLQTHCTNPLLTEKTILRAMTAYFDNLETHDSLFSVDAIRKRSFLSTGEPVNHTNSVLLPTQELDPIYIENSNLFLFSRTSFLSAGESRIGQRPQIFQMNSLEGVDIDFREDFELAKLIYENGLNLGY